MKTNDFAIATLALAAAAMILAPARAQDEATYFRVVSPTTTVITALSTDGMMTWSNAAVGVTGCVQRATTLMGSSNWMDFAGHTVTGTVMALRLFDPNPPSGMVLIPTGSNRGTDPDFGVYSLTVSAFYMDRTEVTKAKWDEVYNWAITNGYGFTNAGSGKAVDHPVQTVNWHDCVKWCNARSEKEGRPVSYLVNGSVYRGIQDNTVTCELNVAGYRLPTDIEWQYAARGGLSGKRFPWGDTIDHNKANYNGNPSYLPYDLGYAGFDTRYSAEYPYTAPVGSFAANGYGLCDMAGNVWEWCWGWYPGWEGSSRVLCGGGWDGDTYTFADACRVAYRGRGNPVLAHLYIGFRAVLPPSQ